MWGAISTKTGERLFRPDEREETKKILKSLGCVIDGPKEMPEGTECSICLEKIKPGTQLTLECGHIYHGKCCKTWANYNYNNKIVDMIHPTNNRKICYFKLNHNIFNCPQCRTEYTRDPFDDFNIRKIHAKIHSTYKGERFVHYLTNPMDITAYIPLSELEADGKIGDKWALYVSILIKVLQTKGKDLYPVKRLHPSPEFLLRSDYVMWAPFGKDGKPTTDTAGLGLAEEHLYELVELEDLSVVLNDKIISTTIDTHNKKHNNKKKKGK